MTVDELVVELALDTKGVDSGAKQLDGQLRRIQVSMSSFVSGIGLAFGNMFGMFIQEAIGFVPRMFNSMKEEVKTLDDLNKRTNASVEDIYAWGSAVQVSGGSAKAFQSTLLHLYSDLSRLSITGRGRSKPFLEALGIDISSISGKPIFDVLEEISKAVDGMDKQKSSLILKNLGFDPDTIKFLQSGNKEVKKLIETQKEFGTYTEKDTEAIDKMDKAVKRIGHAFRTLAIPIFSKVAGVIGKAATYFEKAVLLMRRNTDILKGALLALAFLFSGPLLSAIIKFFSVLMAHPFMLIIAAVTGLLLLLEDLWTYANGGESAFEGIWEKLGDPSKVLEGFEKVAEFMGKIGDILSDGENQAVIALSLFMGLIGALVAAIGAVPLAIAAVIGVLIAFRDEIIAVFSFFKNAIVDLFEKIPGWIGSIFSSLSAEIAEFMTSPVDKIIQKWEALKKWFFDNFGSLEAITNRMTSFGASAQMAKDGAGGGGTTINNDNSSPTVNITATTPQAGAAAGKAAVSAVSKGGKGVR